MQRRQAVAIEDINICLSTVSEDQTNHAEIAKPRRRIEDGPDEHGRGVGFTMTDIGSEVEQQRHEICRRAVGISLGIGCIERYGVREDRGAR